MDVGKPTAGIITMKNRSNDLRVESDIARPAVSCNSKLAGQRIDPW